LFWTKSVGSDGGLWKWDRGTRWEMRYTCIYWVVNANECDVRMYTRSSCSLDNLKQHGCSLGGVWFQPTEGTALIGGGLQLQLLASLPSFLL
jgi:hypothetical protein